MDAPLHALNLNIIHRAIEQNASHGIWVMFVQ